MKRLSVIIVTYHSEADIYDCLASVRKFCDIPKEEVEVIVVDNSLECEPMFSQLRQLYDDDIILVHNTHNGGYGQGNNVGVRRATAPVVMIMNPDVRMMEPVFKTAVEAFEHDEHLLMYGMKQMYSPDTPSPQSFDCSRMMNGYLIPILGPLCNRLDCYLPRWMTIQGSCFFVNRDKFMQVGLFDEDNFMYGEEDDIHYRLLHRFGPHFTYNPRLHYIHLAQDRPISAQAEQKMVEATIALNMKKGLSEKRILRNRIRYYRVRRVSARIRQLLRRPGSDERVRMTQTMIGFLKDRLKQC